MKLLAHFSQELVLAVRIARSDFFLVLGAWDVAVLHRYLSNLLDIDVSCCDILVVGGLGCFGILCCEDVNVAW